MTIKETESVLEREFLQAASKHSEFLRGHEPKKANREYDRLHKLKNKMRHLPDRGEALLKRIAANIDIEVQISAAAALLAVDEAYALKILKRIAETKVGLSSFTAEMTLKEWKKGSIKDYWK